MIVLSMRRAYSKNSRRRKFLIGTTTIKRKTQTSQKISQEDPLNDDQKIAIERTNEGNGGASPCSLVARIFEFNQGPRFVCAANCRNDGASW